jgi:hypothetical protein
MLSAFGQNRLGVGGRAHLVQDPSAIPPYPRGDIRSGASVATRFVERRLARRYGWNLEVFQGREAVFPRSRTGGVYRVVNPARYFLRPSAAIDSLEVAEWLRFGNSIQQLIHVFALAERYGVRRILLPGRHLFFHGERAGDVSLSWDGERRRPVGLALSGYFLHMRALMPPLDAGTEHRIAERQVRPLLARDLLRADPRVGADDLVMHLRGGDAFDPVDVKPGYWQPPLAYYLAAFEHSRPRRVWLVFEDRQNPVVAGAEEALRLRGAEVIVQSGRLIDDLRVLLSARRLVASIGTFLPAVAVLSPRLEIFYQFSRHPSRVLEMKGIQVLRAYDTTGQFTAQVAANWGARPEQLAMMMGYPVDGIRIEVET